MTAHTGDLLDKFRYADLQYLSIGIVERSIIGSTLYCTNLLFAPSGVLLSKHRKLQPTAAERVVWSQGEARYPVKEARAGMSKGEGAEAVYARSNAGDNLPVARTEIGRIGGLICWESTFQILDQRTAAVGGAH